MSTDPYHAVQSEVQSSLQAAETLRGSYLRIRSTTKADSEELIWARDELIETLASLDADIEDLDNSIKIVEETGARMFGIEDDELARRRQYVARVKQTVQKIRKDVSGKAGQAIRDPFRDSGPASPAEDDHQSQWAREEQQMIMQRQDDTIDTISGTLHTLAEQAGLIGREIVEHNELLNDLETGVDNTTSKLDSSMKKLQKFIRDTEETKSGWCIAILIFILIILLLAVVLI